MVLRGDDFAVAVGVAGEGVDAGLEDVADDGEGADHVAVEGAVAGGHLGLVAGGEDERAELVGEGHEERAADAGLEVLFGQAEGSAGEEGLEGALVGGEDVVDGDEFEADAEVGGEGAGVVDGAGGGELAGHADAEDVFRRRGLRRRWRRRGRSRCRRRGRRGLWRSRTCGRSRGCRGRGRAQVAGMSSSESASWSGATPG